MGNCNACWKELILFFRKTVEIYKMIDIYNRLKSR